MKGSVLNIAIFQTRDNAKYLKSVGIWTRGFGQAPYAYGKAQSDCKKKKKVV